MRHRISVCLIFLVTGTAKSDDIKPTPVSTEALLKPLSSAEKELFNLKAREATRFVESRKKQEEAEQSEAAFRQARDRFAAKPEPAAAAPQHVAWKAEQQELKRLEISSREARGKASFAEYERKTAVNEVEKFQRGNPNVRLSAGLEKNFEAMRDPSFAAKSANIKFDGGAAFQQAVAAAAGRNVFDNTGHSIRGDQAPIPTRSNRYDPLPLDRPPMRDALNEAKKAAERETQRQQEVAAMNREFTNFDADMKRLASRGESLTAQLRDLANQISQHNNAPPNQSDRAAIEAYNAVAARLNARRSALHAEVAAYEADRAGALERAKNLAQKRAAFDQKWANASTSR